MNSFRLELSIPGISLSQKGLKGPGPGEGPDLVLNLLNRGTGVTEFTEFLQGRKELFCEAFRISVEGDIAGFYFSEEFLSGKIKDVCGIIRKYGIDPFSEIGENQSVSVSRSSKNDFYIFYSLSRE